MQTLTLTQTLRVNEQVYKSPGLGQNSLCVLLFELTSIVNSVEFIIELSQGKSYDWKWRASD